MSRRRGARLTPDTPVEDLWNLSDLTASWLRDEGVTTHGELAKRDLFELWTALRLAHRQVTRLMFYALWGAVHDCHWRFVPEEEKARFERRRSRLAGDAGPKRAARAPGRFVAKTRAGFRAWLAKNHATSPGVWVVTYKKHTGKPTLDAATISEEALCFGWVDSKPGKVDDERSMLLVTPRNPKSKWSAINKARVEKLIREERMTPAGLAMVALARKTGTWHALDDVERLVVPDDLAARLASEPGPARANFDAFPRSVKRGILEWIHSAKRSETRARRIEETVTKAARNERANQWPRS